MLGVPALDARRVHPLGQSCHASQGNDPHPALPADPAHLPHTLPRPGKTRRLARRAGMGRPGVSRLEEGGGVPTIPVLARLAAALEADLAVGLSPNAACRVGAAT
ncbi:helix-turn-helix domain-containing protein [Nocardiopsis mangrovi]|uniref:Helix-turn-helix domain-containing protein n=1 Tax=Nocardiopsis mangrovi TaxID=1179818 RepID=A0ABV9E5Y7_9ACTN